MIEKLIQMTLDEVVDEIMENGDIDFYIEDGRNGSIFLCPFMHGKIIKFFQSKLFLFGGIENCTQMITLGDDEEENKCAIYDLVSELFGDGNLENVWVVKVCDIGKLT